MVSLSLLLLTVPFFFRLTDPKPKIQKLKQIEMGHLRQLVKSQDNCQEIEELLANYNELVQQISSQIEFLDMITTNEKNMESQQSQN